MTTFTWTFELRNLIQGHSIYILLTRALWGKKEGPRLKQQKRSRDFKILVKGRSSLFNLTMIEHSFDLTWVILSQGWYNTFRTSSVMICFILGLGSISLLYFSTRIHCLWSLNQIGLSSEKKNEQIISDGQMDAGIIVN